MSSASGHHKLSEIGEKVLKQALKDANKGKDFNLSAFYMGNWLTDFSQAIDPVAYKKIETMINDKLSEVEDVTDDVSDGFDVFDDALDDKLDVLVELTKDIRKNKTGLDFFDNIVEKVVTEVGAGIENLKNEALLDKFSANIKEFIPNLKKDVSSFFATANRIDEDNNPNKEPNLIRAVKASIAFIGFPKFVIGTEMDSDVYEAILISNLTQYFPHEHLDRPDSASYAPSGITNYTTHIANKPLSPYSAHDSKDQHHLYQYLRDDIAIAASMLADIDNNWGLATFSPNTTHFTDTNGAKETINDKGIAWNLQLAKLGHALHAVEDFFAHSNFIEHAYKVKPGAFEAVRMKEPIYSTKLEKRLKQWPGPGYNTISEQGNWDKLPAEPHIATGYFDFIDTFHSLSLMAESVFGLSHELLSDHAQKAHDTVKTAKEFEYQEFLVDSLAFFSDPTATHKAHNNGSTPNKALEALENTDIAKDIGVLSGMDEEGLDARTEKIELIVEQIIGSSSLFEGAPSVLTDNYKAAIEFWVKVSAGRTLYSTFKSIITFFGAPIKWMKDQLPGAVTDLLSAYAATTLHQIAGGDRIGSHTLIAKDHGHELFHDPAVACSQAVHWYILHQITRHSRPRVAHVTRSLDSDDSHTLIAVSPWIDWIELLEYFLSHPATKKNGPLVATDDTIETEIVHVIDPSDNDAHSLQTLASYYQDTFYIDDVTRKNNNKKNIPNEFTWQVIAKRNFPTTRNLTGEAFNREINRIIQLQGTGFTVDNRGNQAFKKGTRVIIPFQGIKKTTYQSVPEIDHWWHHVVKSKGDNKWEIFEKWATEQKLITTKDGKLVPPHRHHKIPISKAALESSERDANQLRIEMETAYNRLAE